MGDLLSSCAQLAINGQRKPATTGRLGSRGVGEEGDRKAPCSTSSAPSHTSPLTHLSLSCNYNITDAGEDGGGEALGAVLRMRPLILFVAWLRAGDALGVVLRMLLLLFLLPGCGQGMLWGWF